MEASRVLAFTESLEESTRRVERRNMDDNLCCYSPFLRCRVGGTIRFVVISGNEGSEAFIPSVVGDIDSSATEYVMVVDGDIFAMSVLR